MCVGGGDKKVKRMDQSERMEPRFEREKRRRGVGEGFSQGFCEEAKGETQMWRNERKMKVIIKREVGGGRQVHSA